MARLRVERERGNIASSRLSNHILPTSATMVGVCMTVISIVALSKRAGLSDYVDELLAADSAVFMLSCIFSYLSLRTTHRTGQREAIADILFLVGLALMVVAAFVLSFELI
jgi:hypothetical protein